VLRNRVHFGLWPLGEGLLCIANDADPPTELSHDTGADDPDGLTSLLASRRVRRSICVIEAAQASTA
jgi:hypothetical protein